MIRRYLAQMFADNGLVEVRAIGEEVMSGVFDNPPAMIEAVREMNRSGRWKGIYALLNAMRLRRATNRMARFTGAVKDRDIVRITRLAFDFDPMRAPGFEKCNPPDEELDEARHKALWLQGWLAAKGWPQPLVAMSGNGYHLQYRVSLTPGDELSDVLRALYLGLDARCTTAEVSFDRSIRNPARIFRLYGTTARKSAHTADRPQRITRCKIPDDWDKVSLAQIKSLADQVRPAMRPAVNRTERREFKAGAGDYRTLDVVAWMRANGFYKRHLEGAKHAVICPWSDEHSTEDDPMGTDAVVWEATDGYWPQFCCLHAHCEGKGIRDVMAFFGDADRFCARAYG